MKKIIFVSMFALFQLFAHSEDCCLKDQGFFIKLGSGASISQKSEINAPPVYWDPAKQGYKASLGTKPIILFGVGYDSPSLSGDVTASLRPNFHYHKFQTPTTTNAPGQLPAITRRFDLDVASLMFNGYLNGRGFHPLSWGRDAHMVFPFIGGGIGISRLTIFNFRSTGLQPLVEPFPAFGSENDYSVSYRFTYQVMAGFEYRYEDVCALSIGYRWFDVNRFDGPVYFRDEYGNAFSVGSKPWKIPFSANEAFLEFKIFL